MPLIRTGQKDRRVRLTGNVWDHADLLCSVSRASLRSFCGGPWGDGDHALAREMIRRCRTPPCAQQCFVTEGGTGTGPIVMRNCECSTPGGWKYTSDEDAMRLEGLKPQDVWSDARAMLDHHEEAGFGPDDPIHVDCDDLAEILAAVAVYEAWLAAGCPTRRGLAIEGPNAPEVYTTITQPFDSTTAHAFVESSIPLLSDERVIRSNGLYVSDPARRWGMSGPEDSFYGRGFVARFRVRLSDLAPQR